MATASGDRDVAGKIRALVVQGDARFVSAYARSWSRFRISKW